jgi:hypothetical protein
MNDDTRRFIVTTYSGSLYVFDNEAMTWNRTNKTPGHENIRFLEGVHAGRLGAPVEPVIGESLTFILSDGNWVRTTPVVSVEEV